MCALSRSHLSTTVRLVEGDAPRSTPAERNLGFAWQPGASGHRLSRIEMEKIVKGATKIKVTPWKMEPLSDGADAVWQLAAPKSKYIEPILSATNGGESGVAEVFRTLQLRLRDSTWTIVFKSLIVVHLMIREGQPEVTLRYIAESPKRLAISSFTEGRSAGPALLSSRSKDVDPCKDVTNLKQCKPKASTFEGITNTSRPGFEPTATPRPISSNRAPAK